MSNKNLTGKQFDLYGWTENNTVIEVGIIKQGNTYGYGWVGSFPYAVQEYPIFTNNVDVYGGQGKFYNFDISAFTNGSIIASISNFTSNSFYYPIHYTSFQSSNTITMREARNGPQYYEYAFIRSLPIDNIMPVTSIW